MAESDVTIRIAALDQATQQIQRVADSLTKLHSASKPIESTFTGLSNKFRQTTDHAGALMSGITKASTATAVLTKNWGLATQGATQLGAGMMQLNQGFSGAVAGATSIAAGLKNMTAGLGGAGIAAAGAATAIGSVVAAVGVGIGIIVKFASDTAVMGDELWRMSLRTGMSVSELSKWKFAVEQSEGSLAELGIGFKMLANNMQAASEGNDKVAGTFSFLGVEIKDKVTGQLRDVNDVFLDISRGLQGVTSGTEKSAIAVDLFGRSGTSLIPLLNEGSTGIRNLWIEAEKLNAVMRDATGEMSDKYNDAITRHTASWNGLKREIGEGALPAMTKFWDLLSKVVASAPTVWKTYIAVTGQGGVFGLGVGGGEAPEEPYPEYNVPKESYADFQKRAEAEKKTAEERKKAAEKAAEERKIAADKLFREVMGGRAANAAALSGAQAARLSVPMSLAPGRIGIGGRPVGSGMAGLSLAEYQRLNEKAFTPGADMNEKWDRFARYIKGLFQGTTGVWGSMKAGAEEFKRQLGSFRTILSESLGGGTFNMLASMQSGLQKGFSGLIFGTQKEDDVKNSIKQLKSIKGQVQNLALDVYARPGGLQQNQLMTFEALFGLAEKGGIPENLKTRMGEIKAELFSVRTPEQGAALVKSMEELIGQLQDQTGLMGRIREFGSSLQDSMVDAFKFELSNLLAKGVMAGLMWSGDALWDKAFGDAKAVGAHLGNDVADGSKINLAGIGTFTVKKIGEEFDDASTGVPSIAGKIGAGLSTAGSAGGTIGKAIIKSMDAAFIDPKIGMPSLVPSIENGLGAAGGAGKKIGTAIISGLSNFLADPIGGVATIAMKFDSLMSGNLKEDGLFTTLGKRIGNVLLTGISGGLSGLSAVVEGVCSNLETMGGAVTTFLGKTIDAAGNNTIATSIVKGLADIGNNIGTAVTEIGNLGTAVTGFLSIAVDAEGNNKIINSITKGFGSVPGIITNLGTDLVNGAKHVTTFYDATKGKISAGLGITQTTLNTLSDFASGVGGGLSDTVGAGKSILDFAVHKGKIAGTILEGLADLAGEGAGGIASKLGTITSAISKGIGGLFGEGSQTKVDFKTGLEGAITGAFMGASIAHVFAPGTEQFAAITAALGGLVGAAFGSAQIGGAIGSMLGIVVGKMFGEGEQAKKGFTEITTDIQAFGGVKGWAQRIGLTGATGAKGFEKFMAGTQAHAAIFDKDASKELERIFRVQLGITSDQADALMEYIKAGAVGKDTGYLRGLEPAMLAQLRNVLILLGQTDLSYFDIRAGGGVTPTPAGKIVVPTPPPTPTPEPTPSPPTPPPAPPPIVDPEVLLAQQAMAIFPHLQAAYALKKLSTSWLRGVAGGWPAIDRAIGVYGAPFTDARTGLKSIFQDADPSGWGAYTLKLGTGISMVARQGLSRVPGPDDSAYPAILHGGERVLSAPQVRQMDTGRGGNNVTFILNIYANSDQGLIDVIQKKALPMIRNDIKNTLTREARFGTWSMDDRAVRQVLTNS